MKRILFLDSPLGRIGIAENGRALTDLFFGEELPPDALPGSTPLLERAAGQLEEYFAGIRTAFDLPLEAAGTPFQRRVWEALREIPYGTTVSYAHIAARTGAPRASRAVGAANRRNPLAIVVPCHRIIGADGSLTGYAGGLERKEFLLRLERAATEKTER